MTKTSVSFIKFANMAWQKPVKAHHYPLSHETLDMCSSLGSVNNTSLKLSLFLAL